MTIIRAFKPGDRVRRIKGAHGKMRVGDEATVKEQVGTSLYLKEYSEIHAPYNFELVTTDTTVVTSPMILPADPQVRKGMPITTGVVDYFPLALAEVAVVSKAGNDQHNPGQPLHWEKGLSTDHADCILRHLIDRGARDTDGMRHSAKLAWRALALLQTELEAEAAKA
jgi:hypothetical protein